MDILMEIAHIVMGFRNEDSSAHYKMLCEIEELIANQSSLNEAEQRDAARYRWLRALEHQGAQRPDGEGPLVVTDRPTLVPRYLGPLFGDALDKAIDAAMSAQSGDPHEAGGTHD